jgi:hypothetical protein
MTTVGEGEDLSKNGFAALTTDRTMQDDLYQALVNHTHDASPRLADPAAEPTLSASTSGGVLPANTTLYYKFAYLDRWGLETAGGPEGSITTPLGQAAPTAPAATAETTGGTLTSGQYAYSLTGVDANGGETTASPFTQVQATASGTTRIRLLLPPLAPGVDHYRIYRAKPGQISQYLLADNITDLTYYDDGSVSEDQTITTPTINTTGNQCSITVTLPGATPVLPDGAFSWKIYRAISPGNYDGYNLVHHVVETISEFSTEIRVSWVDDGTELNLGIPRSVSSTVSGGRVVQLSGVAGGLPLSVIPRGSRSISTRVDSVADGVEFYKTRYSVDIQPTIMTAWFQTPPTGLTGATPPTITIQLWDSAATPHHFDLVCVGDSGYYVAEFPLTISGTFEAESGLRALATSEPIVNDPNASNGQAVEINAQDEFAAVSLGVLDPGTYVPTMKLIESDPGFNHPADDIELRVVLLNDDDTIASDIAVTDFANSGYSNTAYSVLTGDPFTLSTPTKVGLAAQKRTTSTGTYWIDSFSFSAVLGTLAAGDLFLTTVVDGVPSSLGSDVAVTVWF